MLYMFLHLLLNMFLLLFLHYMYIPFEHFLYMFYLSMLLLHLLYLLKSDSLPDFSLSILAYIACVTWTTWCATPSAVSSVHGLLPDAHSCRGWIPSRGYCGWGIRGRCCLDRSIYRYEPRGNNFIKMETEKFLCYTDYILPWKGHWYWVIWHILILWWMKSENWY